MIAENLLPFYRDAARGRQMDLAGTRPNNTDLPQKVAEGKNSDAREAAGKAAGVSGSYADKANDPEAKGRQMDLAGTRPNNTDLVVKLPPPEKSKARDARGDMAKKSLVVKLPQVKAREAAGNAYTPLRLSSVRSMPPTRYRASWTHGDGIGMGLVGTENKKSYLAAVLSPCWFLEAASL